MNKFSAPGAGVTHADVIASHDYVLVEPTTRLRRLFRRTKLTKITKYSIRLTHENSSQSTWTRTPNGIKRSSSVLAHEAHIIKEWFGYVPADVVCDFLTLEGVLSFHRKYNDDSNFVFRCWVLLNGSKDLTHREFCALVETELAKRRHLR